MKQAISRARVMALLFSWAGVIVFACVGPQALAQSPPRNFDHLTTGFPLVGIHTAQRCESCHIDGVFKGTPKDCASCHTSGLRHARSNTVKPPRHIPTQMNCDSCHNTQTFTGARFNHSGVVAGTCATCHNGITAPGRPANHIPYQTVAGVAITNCDTCHKGGFAAWTPARFHSNVPVSTQCASCHNGSYPPAVGKPNTPWHVGVTACELCHRSSSNWLAVQFTHSPANAVGTGTCDTCHTGTGARGKPATHIPVTTGLARCDACHRSQASFATAVAMNHSVVTTSACKSCHNGNYTTQGVTGALAKPANHIPESQLLNGAGMDCNACHASTANWAGVRMNHGASLGGGAGWCKSCHATGSNYLGNMERQALTHKTKTPPAIDCSESGCHRPVGNVGAAFRNWK
ncbi:cytochrome c3 family protein [Polaromonas jejuensis]|uniref:Cytochrome c3 family protein n=1 Tax=Polaromonas jejuensis TaxID=457502 RepID=A0ABW0Q5V2_9BURK|nr:cytochrome c3 family protein [Polaromonas jejuensis]